MATWVITTPLAGAQGIDQTSTTQNHPLGTRVRAKDVATTAYGEGEFIYALGVASTAVASWVAIFPDGYTTALLDSAASHKQDVGVSMSANVASQYGWYQIYGKAVGKVLAAFADNGDVYATTTAGSVDDAVVDGYLVHKARGASAIDTPSTGLAEIEISYPYTDGIAGND